MAPSRNSSEADDVATLLTEQSRREFLLRLGKVVAGSAIIAATPRTVAAGKKKLNKAVGPLSVKDIKARRKAVYALRKNLARAGFKAPLVPFSVNGDEAAYPDGVATFTKSLPHYDNGIVDPAALHKLVNACDAGSAPAFEEVPAGGDLQLKNPMAAYAYTLSGIDSHNVYLPPPPSIASAEQAAEAAEVYWQALLRDVPFTQYEEHPLVQAACDDLNTFPEFRGPRLAGAVTPQTLFRGTTTGELEGPYLSQFLLKPMLMGHTPLPQKYLCAVPGSDFVQTWEEWLSVQRGHVPPLDVPFLPDKRHLMNGRDTAHHAHLDFPYQSAMAAALAMTEMGIPESPENPYHYLSRQCSFGTLGQPDMMAVIAQVTPMALKAAWRHKWTLHRRTRPEEFGGRLHRMLTAEQHFPAHPDFLRSRALEESFSANGTYLLTQAYPEGCPCHPSYPSGHATFIGACVTLLKAFYNEIHPIPHPVVPSDDGQTLVPYSGPPLTVNGELNKLASNIAFGRNFAGVHWRSDASEGVRLGERVAIGLLADLKTTYREQFNFRFTSFDGAAVTI